MLKLKACLHLHIQGDPIENIKYSHTELFKQAKQNGFDVLAITCHDKFVFSEEIEKLSKKFNIVVIPGIEQTIQNKHVLILNCDKSIESVKTFDQLKGYKNRHPECLIVAPHPYHLLPNCLGKDLTKNIEIFDALEWNYFYSKLINPNKLTLNTATKYNKPIVATSDVHLLKHLNRCYTVIKSNSKEIPDILSAIKNNQIEIHTKPYKTVQLPFALLELILQTR